ncbi:MAG: N-6 DNA methylase, partial [Alphaproteobacteria bacterium]
MEGLIAPLREHVLAAVGVARKLKLGGDWLEGASRHDSIRADLEGRVAWAAVAVTLIDMIRTGLPADGARAGAWFGLGGSVEWSALDSSLRPLPSDTHLLELLPYLLDTYGRTTRLNVMRDTTLSTSRAERKKVGSFYTPADVADFMVAAIAAPAGCDLGEWWLDPAVGSGVFLAAALRRYHGCGRVAFAESRLTGCDISPQACDFAAFALLAEIAAETQNPLRTWAAIRRNLLAVDTPSSARAGDLRARLAPGTGPLRLICNPPYATG